MKRPVSSFPPEFFDVWRLAMDGSLRLEFAARNTAVNFKHRLYAFRRRLIEETPDVGQPFYEVDLDIQEEVVATETGTQTRFLIVPYVPDWKRQLREKIGTQQAPAKAEGNFEQALDKLFK